VSTLSTQSQLDQLCINTIRTLSIDAVQQANSGHPGMPMAMAPVVYCLWQCFLRFDPEHPIWPSRDRFVLSAGHASGVHPTTVANVRQRFVEEGVEAALHRRRARGMRRWKLDGQQEAHLIALACSTPSEGQACWS
jgi:transketolase N-terminal domain/subunit